MLLSTGFLLKRLGWTIKERAHEALESTGLSSQHHAVLSLLDELEEQGLIARKRDPEDRRRHVVKLTPAGREALTELRAVTKTIEKEFLAPLSAEERRTLHSLLQRIASYHDPRLGPKP